MFNLRLFSIEYDELLYVVCNVLCLTCIAGAFGYFEVTHDITKYCKAKIFSHVGKKTPIAIRFSTVGKAAYTSHYNSLFCFVAVHAPCFVMEIHMYTICFVVICHICEHLLRTFILLHVYNQG